MLAVALTLVFTVCGAYLKHKCVQHVFKVFLLNLRVKEIAIIN